MSGPIKFGYAEYSGISAEEASRQALHLVQEAARTGKTLGDLAERLIFLRWIYEMRNVGKN